MDIQQVLDAYDQTTASRYDQRFILSEPFKEVIDCEVEILSGFLQEIGNDGEWLDVACGTGYFLSCFPEWKRTGLDLSPSMLTIAREKNPNALLIEGNFKDKFLEWNAKWNLVSCMWWAYCYVKSISESEQLIENLAYWTSEQGICFMPICELKDITNNDVELPYIHKLPQANAAVQLTGFTWTWIDGETGKRHENLIAPNVDHLVTVFKKYFDSVEILNYSAAQQPKKAIVARSKKRISIC